MLGLACVCRVLLPWVCGVLVCAMLQPSVRYRSVLGCHVLGLSPLQALGGALATPLMATYTVPQHPFIHDQGACGVEAD